MSNIRQFIKSILQLHGFDHKLNGYPDFVKRNITTQTHFHAKCHIFTSQCKVAMGRKKGPISSIFQVNLVIVFMASKMITT